LIAALFSSKTISHLSVEKLIGRESCDTLFSSGKKAALDDTGCETKLVAGKDNTGFGALGINNDQINKTKDDNTTAKTVFFSIIPSYKKIVFLPRQRRGKTTFCLSTSK
jgi:hypothetical protein